MSGRTALEENIQEALGIETADDATAEMTDPTSALVGVYSQLNGLRGAGETFALMEHPSDEMIGPTRGTDWSDFGVWRQLHAHTWGPSHAQLSNPWHPLNSGISRASQVVESP